MHPLIEVPALDRLLRRQTPVVLLDVRWHLAGPPGVESYRRGHLPGAVFVDLDRDVAGPPGPGGRHPLPEPVVFEAAMRRAGVTADSLVVAYDDADAMSAARVWWSLRYFGHDRVRVLDGGFRAWTEAGLPVSTTEPDVKPGGFIAHPGRLPVLDAEGAAELATAGVLLDARAAARYRGEEEPVDPVAGHIPGARNAPTSGNVGVDGRFLPPELLRERFAQLGATDALDVGAYCGSGVTAAHEILALNLAGIPAALYVGSWSDWVTNPTNPVATGDN
ncbi:sulfurtransferase [Actinomadura darangshiensis]|uniref:sulfurtransferase n=1 Tax=Actinomadura darangshiensis TaxID=705336 RepID=UPI001FB75F83|nr:sulfurtransferase [Actinomadura darangshiensis]